MGQLSADKADRKLAVRLPGKDYKDRTRTRTQSDSSKLGIFHPLPSLTQSATGACAVTSSIGIETSWTAYLHSLSLSVSLIDCVCVCVFVCVCVRACVNVCVCSCECFMIGQTELRVSLKHF